MWRIGTRVKSNSDNWGRQAAQAKSRARHAPEADARRLSHSRVHDCVRRAALAAPKKQLLILISDTGCPSKTRLVHGLTKWCDTCLDTLRPRCTRFHRILPRMSTHIAHNIEIHACMILFPSLLYLKFSMDILDSGLFIFCAQQDALSEQVRDCLVRCLDTSDSSGILKAGA